MPRLVAIVLVAGGFVLFKTATAVAASPSISVRPATGLTGGKKVTVSGSGLAASAKGYVLECNEAPGEPTIHIGPPFDESLPIGCSAPSLRRITATTSDGTLATITIVHEGRKLGPPCGVFPVIAGCGRADTAGKRPHADAQNYPCPPSPIQQVVGVRCALVFIDTGQDQVSAPITFLGAAAPPPVTVPPTTPLTVPPTTPGTVPHTSPGTTPHTTPGGSTGGAPGSTGTSTGGASGGAGGAGTVGGAVPPSTAAGTVSAGSGSLAFTGLGLPEKILAIVGALLVLFGLALYFLDLKRVGVWFLGR
ncbi:MAG TPA: hypothetical protein VII76_17135 [Acidimicrobiales bacterium]